MTVPVQQRLFADRCERQRAAVELSHNEFLKHQCAGRKLARVAILDQRRNLVAEADQATWLEPDHRHATRHERREGCDAALGFAPRLLDRADGKERATAAQWPIVRPQQMNPAAGGVQNSERGFDVFRLEIAAEGIHEQHDLAAMRGPDRRTRLAVWRAPARQAAARAEARKALRQPGQPRDPVAQVEQPRYTRS